VQPWTNAVETEEHDSQKTCFQENGRQYFHGNHRSNRRSSHLGEASEPETKLEPERTIPVTTPIPKPIAKMPS
jgi:hypothetical protein